MIQVIGKADSPVMFHHQAAQKQRIYHVYTLSGCKLGIYTPSSHRWGGGAVKRMLADESVDPSLMTMNSISVIVCALRESRHFGRYFSTLWTGTMTDTFGIFFKFS